jgi:hypothetical protein
MRDCKDGLIGRIEEDHSIITETEVDKNLKRFPKKIELNQREALIWNQDQFKIIKRLYARIKS